ncbi:multidrug resistance protein mrp-7-like isoform X2 [Haemaphysalis longicornis]
MCPIQSYFHIRNHVRAELLLQTAVFKKVTRLSASAIADNPAGLVSSLLVADCWVVAVSTYYLPSAVVGVVCAPIALAALAGHIGLAPALACLAWLLVILAASLAIEPFLYKCCDVLYRYRDERLRKFTDFLSSVRHIKMSALEDVFQENLRQLRLKEIDQAYRVNTLESVLETVITATSSVMIIIAFGTVTIMRGDVTFSPATVFACVYILTLMDIFTGYLPHTIRLKTPVSRSCRRLMTFFRAEEHCEMEARKPDLDQLADGQVTIKGCSFSWTKRDVKDAAAVLHGVDLDMQGGSLFAVIGSVGSGKSSLLSAITGNMRCLGGCLRLKGKIGIVAQAAQVLNMTIRDNITFGRTFDCEFYSRVLEACQLVRDIDMFPAGDLTEAGEKGEMLSGGQKQRVALARAVYSRSDIYLLDDPTSAQDPRVARCILEQVIGPKGILADKTRLLVTNSPRLPFCVDRWVLMHEKRAAMFEDLKTLKEHPGVPVTLLEDLYAPNELEATKDGGCTEGDFTKEQKEFRVVKDEGMLSEKGTLQVILAYFEYSGVDAVLALLCFIASAVLVACQLLCIKAWALTMTSTGTDPSTSSKNMVGLLAIICIGDVIFRLGSGALLAAASRRCSLSLHSEMLRRIAGSPLSFFDATPRARILNRFSMDLEVNDTRVFVAYKQLFQNVLCVVTRLGVVGSQAPIVFGLGCGAVIVLIFVMRYFVPATMIGRLYESTRASLVLHHLMETLDCVGLIRCYGVMRQFCARFRRLLDDFLEAYNMFAFCFSFNRLLVTVCGVVIVVLTVLIVIVPGHEDSAANTGLSLLSSLTVPFAMAGAFAVLFWSTQGGVAYERTLEYTELPMEQQMSAEHASSADSPHEESTSFFAEPYDDYWPSKGLVKFQNFSASYCPGIAEDALKDISFEAHPGEKVAVVGRTGAGKSTLVLALLRMIERTSGTLTIDGTDICSIPLKRLRTAISIIPQDPSLFSGTLRENLDPRSCHSDLELWAVLRDVHFNDFVKSIPEGLLFLIGEKGGNLSAGQRQLVSLARALLRATKIIVLDEATSQMDQETDRKVQRVLRESFSRCTFITIAHRIDTVLDYDKVIVMGDGRVLECGRIKDLLAQPQSTFYSMVQSSGINPDLKCLQREHVKSPY